jgi:flagellar motor switch protein FliM
MSDKIDTSPEAVEQWVLAQEVLGNGHIAALLRQLAKERDEARNAALEEAAKHLDKYSFENEANMAAEQSSALSHIADVVSGACADAIRALKTTAAAKSPDEA